jgi:hypothetical protein
MRCKKHKCKVYPTEDLWYYTATASQGPWKPWVTEIQWVPPETSYSALYKRVSETLAPIDIEHAFDDDIPLCTGIPHTVVIGESNMIIKATVKLCCPKLVPVISMEVLRFVPRVASVRIIIIRIPEFGYETSWHIDPQNRTEIVHPQTVVPCPPAQDRPWAFTLSASVTNTQKLTCLRTGSGSVPLEAPLPLFPSPLTNVPTCADSTR